MAKPIVLTYQGKESSFAHTKLDRTKLYGKRQRVPLDQTGERCERAELTRDGSLVIRSKMTAQGYFDEQDCWVPNARLVGLDAEGQVVEKVGSTLGVAQALEGPVDPAQVLELGLRSVYQLDPDAVEAELSDALDRGEIFRFRFNYRADYNAETAFLLANDNGVFALIGNPTQSEWCEFEAVAPVAFDEADDEEDDDLDFEMF